MNKLFAKLPALVLALVVGILASSTAFAQANIVIENIDLAGAGFNDPTTATPVGGNTGTTIGQQRLIAFQRAAAIWGATLPGGPTITIRANWDASLQCIATSGTLGSAGATGLFANFPGAPFPSTWYGSALANSLAGVDLDPANPEIRARFNPDIGTMGCLQNSHWYYGLDTNDPQPFGSVNLVTVLLHEFAHGLGFQTFTSSSTGAPFGTQRFPSIYDRFLLDNTTGKLWKDMTDAERVASAVNSGNLVWSGPQVLGDATFLAAFSKDAQGHPRVFAPDPVQGGSSVSHWDSVAFPDQLMEPNISSGLSHSVRPPEDLTFSLMTDIGWCAVNCPPAPPPPSPTPTPPVPGNNDFASPQLINGCSGSVTGTNVGANKEIGEPSHDPLGDAGGGSVWYQWTAVTSTSVTITTAGSDYDTMLGVYTGNAVGGLTTIAKNDDVELGEITTSTVTFTATAGTVYKIAVDGWGGDRGNITLNWTQTNCSQVAMTLLTEPGTNQAIALDSVTQTRGPFRKLGLFNFSSDQRTRLMLFTNSFSQAQGNGLSVQIGGVTVPIENMVFSTAGASPTGYIVVRLTDQVPTTGLLNVNVMLNGVPGNTATVEIIP